MSPDTCPITVRSPISGLEPTNYIAPDVRIKWRRAQRNGIMLAMSLASVVGAYLWSL